MEDLWMYTLLPIIGGLLLSAVMSEAAKAPGRALQQKFVGLGQLAGKTRAQIEAVVGPPQAVSAALEGKTVVQWITTGYHIVLIFGQDGVCEGVNSEVVV